MILFALLSVASFLPNLVFAKPTICTVSSDCPDGEYCGSMNICWSYYGRNEVVDAARSVTKCSDNIPCPEGEVCGFMNICWSKQGRDEDEDAAWLLQNSLASANVRRDEDEDAAWLLQNSLASVNVRKTSSVERSRASYNYRNVIEAPSRDVIEPVSRSVEPVPRSVEAILSRNLSSCMGLCHLNVVDTYSDCIRKCKFEDDRARMKAMYGGGRAEERESVRQDLPNLRLCIAKCNDDTACFAECGRTYWRSIEAPREVELTRKQQCLLSCDPNWVWYYACKADCDLFHGRSIEAPRMIERKLARQDLPELRLCFSKCNNDNKCFEECAQVYGRSMEAPRMIEATRIDAARSQACEKDCNNRGPDGFMSCWRSCTRNGRQFE